MTTLTTRWYTLPRWLRDFAPLIIWMALIFALSNRSTLVDIEDETGEKFFYKIAHIIAYTILAWLWWRALAPARQTTWPILLAALTLTVLYAGSDEFHQSFVPGRHAALHDILFDTGGGLMMVLLVRYAGHWRYKWPALYTLISR